MEDLPGIAANSFWPFSFVSWGIHVRVEWLRVNNFVVLKWIKRYVYCPHSAIVVRNYLKGWPTNIVRGDCPKQDAIVERNFYDAPPKARLCNAVCYPREKALGSSHTKNLRTCT